MSTQPKSCSFLDCLSTKLKKMNSDTVLYHHLPILGATSYATLSVNVMNPSLIMRMSPTRDVTNVLLSVSVIGSMLYMSNRPHLRSCSVPKRVLFSGFGAVTFNFGSVLLWAVLRSSTRSNCVATIIGLFSGAGLAYVGYNYIQHLDKIGSE